MAGPVLRGSWPCEPVLAFTSSSLVHSLVLSFIQPTLTDDLVQGFTALTMLYITWGPIKTPRPINSEALGEAPGTERSNEPRAGIADLGPARVVTS